MLEMMSSLVVFAVIGLALYAVAVVVWAAAALIFAATLQRSTYRRRVATTDDKSEDDMSDSDNPSLHAPVEVEVKVLIINPETSEVGVGTLTMGHLRYPTQREMADAVAEFEGTLEDSAPGYRLMTKDEAFNYAIQKEYGPQRDEEGEPVSFASPGGPDWDPLPEE